MLQKTVEDLQKKDSVVVLSAFEAEGERKHFVWLECK